VHRWLLDQVVNPFLSAVPTGIRIKKNDIPIRLKLLECIKRVFILLAEFSLLVAVVNTVFMVMVMD
jgi:hypothetical protein